ncbi:MAG TPA: hypothetical protein VGG74_12675 [Kofleriaceae bacterium]|jgi:hypothetical protein
MIRLHVATDGTRSFQVYGRARVRDKSVRVYVGSFASKRDAEAADEEHRVTQRGIRAGDLPPAVDHKRTLGDPLDVWLRAIKEQPSHDVRRSHAALRASDVRQHAVREDHEKAKLIDLRASLKERDDELVRAPCPGRNARFFALFGQRPRHIERG